MPHPENIPILKKTRTNPISPEEMEERAAAFSKAMREDELQTMRRKFASMAMQGRLANPSFCNDRPEEIAQYCVVVANALIAKLEE